MNEPAVQEKRGNILIFFIGVITGISIRLNVFANSPKAELNNFTFLIDTALAAVAFSLSLFGLRRIIRRIVRRSSLADSVRNRYLKYDSITYTVFLSTLLGALGVQFGLHVIILMLLLFLALQIFLIYFLMTADNRKEMATSTGWLSFLFLISGFAALIYQIVWQKALFTAFGVNIESVTIVVSIFMFGLGMGSLIGGVLSKKYPSLLAQFFLAFEILIGTFGIISLPLIKTVSYAPVHNSLLKISLATFSLLCFPTILMGATLPVLVAYLHMYYKNVGKTVGKLYFMNTIGSAIACFMTADLLFVLFGKQTTVVVAAFCNFVVGFLVYKYTKGNAGKIETDRRIEAIDAADERLMPQMSVSIRFFVILLLSAMTGYISLSQEILWFRAISYTTGGKPDVFAHILGFFLFGIAFGALFAKKICEKEKDYTLSFIAAMLSFSAVFYYLSMPLSGTLLAFSSVLGMNELYLSVGILSFLLGGIFPALCHFGIRSSTSVGFSLSWIYFANILGSTAGPLLTGFILLNSYSLEQNILYLSLITLILAGIVWINSPVAPSLKRVIMGGVIFGAMCMLAFHGILYSQMLEKLHYKDGYTQKDPYKFVVQNRNGIIAVEAGRPDVVYGGGIYDGRINIDPVRNSNLITRAYMTAALHPKPEEILEIGMSGGSWSRVLANHSSVKSLTVVEINPGYVELIKRYPEIETILRDPKVTICIDDGRRWLNRNAGRKFDLIVMNTTFHWRDGITNLLSDEFLRLCKSHLKKGGILYYNMTFSQDVPFTAAQIFKHVVVYRNFVIASDTPFTMTEEERRQNLLGFHNSGRPVFPEDNMEAQKVLAELAAVDLSDRSGIIRAKSGLWLITDDNMATEFKKRNQWVNPETSWGKLFERFIVNCKK